MERQDTLLSNLHREQPREVPNTRKQGSRIIERISLVNVKWIVTLMMIH